MSVADAMLHCSTLLPLRRVRPELSCFSFRILQSSRTSSDFAFPLYLNDVVVPVQLMHAAPLSAYASRRLCINSTVKSSWPSVVPVREGL